ncbi:MAG TPA: aminotransferase class V-fold PLP-dependent enzyme, partial [Longimicrobium sp.]|nr:aminotransferase class V-fold PLP-dependent enzyme [Longimicrobium sp.]
MTKIGTAPGFTWSAEETRRIGYRVVDMIAEYLETLPEKPVFQPLPPERVAAFRAAPLPERGETADAVLDAFGRDVAPWPFGNGHPRFFGWVNGPPAPIGIMAEALAAAMNPSVAGGNQAAVHLEHQVIGWFRQLLGFPESSYGHLVSGASAASIVALAAARHAACARRGWDVRAAGVQGGAERGRLVVYKGAEGHGCIAKAVELLGIGGHNLRTVPADAALRMRPDALDQMIAADLADGCIPVAVAASAGTVNTGAIDPLDGIADVCARHGVWLHVDGAYGAPASLVEEYRAPLAGIARADSVAVDPHKWMCIPVDAGLVLVRHAQTLRDALSLVPAYLRTDGDEAGVHGPPWFSEYSIEQTRPFRALKVWMALRHLGVDGYRALIRHDLDLARHLADRIRADGGFQIWAPQGLSIVCFRAVPAALAGGEAALDELNRAVVSRVQLGGETFLSGTVLDGRFWLRACVVNPHATSADVERLADAVTVQVQESLTQVSRVSTVRP